MLQKRCAIQSKLVVHRSIYACIGISAGEIVGENSIDVVGINYEVKAYTFETKPEHDLNYKKKIKSHEL